MVKPETIPKHKSIFDPCNIYVTFPGIIFTPSLWGDEGVCISIATQNKVWNRPMFS